MVTPPCSYAPRRSPVPDLPGTTYSALMTTDAAVKDMAKYASGVGPWKNTLYVPTNITTNVTANGAALVSTGVGERIQKYGMQMHPYTFRDEAFRLEYGNFATPYDEYELFFVKLGIEGCFTDFPQTLAKWIQIKVC